MLFQDKDFYDRKNERDMQELSQRNTKCVHNI